MAECSRHKVAGDAAFKLKQFDLALESYDAALQVNAKFVAVWSNRAALHLALDRFADAIADCSRALDILLDGHANEFSGRRSFAAPKHGSRQHTTWVVKTLVRRAAAHYQCGNLDAAIADFESAVEREPENEQVKSDLSRVILERENCAASADNLGN